jgi:hypothetical protein
MHRAGNAGGQKPQEGKTGTGHRRAGRYLALNPHTSKTEACGTDNATSARKATTLVEHV